MRTQIRIGIASATPAFTEQLTAWLPKDTMPIVWTGAAHPIEVFLRTPVDVLLACREDASLERLLESCKTVAPKLKVVVVSASSLSQSESLRMVKLGAHSLVARPSNKGAARTLADDLFEISTGCVRFDPTIVPEAMISHLRTACVRESAAA